MKDDMRLLSDTTECAQAFLGTSQPEWTPHLNAHDHAVWNALGMATEPLVAEVATDTAWQRLVVVTDAPSSQLDALGAALGQGWALDGSLACVALDGRGFHGQRRREWATQTGNLFLTAVFAPQRTASKLLASLVMLPAVALVDAIRETTHLDPSIKWVNDVLIGESKVAGVLTATQCKGELLETALIGIGANVLCTPEVPPTVFVPSVTSLREQGASTTLPAFTQAVLASLSRRYRQLLVDPFGLYSAYCACSCVLGREVSLWDENIDALGHGDQCPEPLVCGVVDAIAPDLSLTLSNADTPVTRGRLAFQSVCRDLDNRTKKPHGVRE
ncbi:MAG: hypothetical protein A2289_09535 [Deltaproteobacteria bacterium RIFOXYA12_FULL_58_15]|nr:MAG: hypothetical protein A2289_09535 [Deltaproteobacteria bacterium RIFOXYA12_FULL_58_15]OGR07085.1 MAG: hypothetical protein A2341_08080 [Deltaproteobacteria bacterium RIFOXYB12_FULL_58_9]